MHPAASVSRETPARHPRRRASASAQGSESLTRAIARAPLPEELVLPLSQHTGAPSEPIVTVGDQVLKGQMIARATATLSVALHAPTSGEIVAIAPRPLPHPSGMDGMAIVLRADGAVAVLDRAYGTPRLARTFARGSTCSDPRRRHRRARWCGLSNCRKARTGRGSPRAHADPERRRMRTVHHGRREPDDRTRRGCGRTKVLASSRGCSTRKKR